ncbi:MAG: penicillin-binding protein 2 [Kiritimatiellae bacterium]|nr:penicillin-binding protein 2 [Kiritimatiellia bacterium]
MSVRRLKFRLAGTILVIAAAWSGLGARLAWLHLAPQPERREMMNRTRMVRQELIVNRGRIMDRNGIILATDRRRYHVNADPSSIQSDGKVDFFAGCLSHVLKLPRAELIEKLSRPNRKQVYLAQGLEEEAAAVAPMLNRVGNPKKIQYLWLEPVYDRHYPQESAACHVVGFANREGKGQAGIELVKDSYLRGVPGERESLRDARGVEQPIHRLSFRPPEPGDTVELTLDINLQRITEEALEAAQSEHGAKGAWSIMMDVQTGEILALAARPGFDLNQYGQANEDQWLNRPIGYSYEPGSTFKAPVIAAAFNEGLIQPETIFDCERGVWMHQGRPLKDYHPYGRLSVADILKKSSNIGTAKIALMLGEARAEKYLREFGFGSRSGIDLPGEEAGILHPASRWDRLTLSRMAMGHSVMATSLQIVNAFACLANDGERMRPAIVRRITNARGVVLEEFHPTPVARPIRPETARLMMKLLSRVTEDGGTGRRAAVPGYSVAGKTGTAEKVTDGRYDSSRNVASFVGVIPANSPRLAMIVVVDEPRTARGTGGLIAAPVFARIAGEALRYLDIPPEGPVRVLEPLMDEPINVEEDSYAFGFTG